MSDQEKQLVVKVSRFILAKIMNSNTNLVDYSVIEKEINVPTPIVRTAASQICQCLMTSKRVEDVDCIDNEAFDVMLKRRTVRV